MTPRLSWRDGVGLAGWILAVFGMALIGSIASLDAGDFYAQLERPAWAPPAWLFGPVWTVLYLMMALAGWLHWRQHGFDTHRLALSLFGVQLVLNALWSWLFFAWQRGAWSFADIVLLLAAIAAVIGLFRRAGSSGAGLLLVPYLAWVVFAAVLNWSVWQANPALL